MLNHRRIRIQALALGAIGAGLLAAPRAANARTESGGCGVCYTMLACNFGDGGSDCMTFCGSGNAGSCQEGIPGGWVCYGSGNYESFRQCF